MECRDLIDEAKNYHLMPERRSNFNSIFKINIRVCTEMPGNIYVLGGLNQIQPSTVEFYDPTIKKWKPSKVMTSQRTRFVCFFEEIFFKFGVLSASFWKMSASLKKCPQVLKIIRKFKKIRKF